MNLQGTPTLVICAAMRWEVRPVLRALHRVRVVRGGETRLWSGTAGTSTILVCQTGVGVEAAATATKAILRDFSPDLLINTGCAGSLTPHLAVGDVVCGSTLLAFEAGQMSQYRTDPSLMADLGRAATTAGLRPIVGPVLTSPVPLLTSEAKAAAFDQCAAMAVEMEGAAIAKASATNPLRLASVRVILDDASTTLPAPRTSNTRFDFVKNTATAILSVEEVQRFSVLAKNAVIVDRVLEKLFNSYLRSGCLHVAKLIDEKP